MGKAVPRYGLLFGDLVLMVAAFLGAYGLRGALGGIFPMEARTSFGEYWAAILLALGTWILLFWAFQLDMLYVGRSDLPLTVSRLLTSLVALIAALLAGAYLGKQFSYSRLTLVFLMPLLALLLFLNRLAFQFLLKRLRKYGVGVRRVVIVGQSDMARELGRRIQEHQELNYELVGYVWPALNPNPARDETTHLATGGSEEMARALASRSIDELIFATPIRRDTGVLDFVAHCQKQGLRVRLIPEYYDLHAHRITGFSIDGIPILELRESSLDPLAQLSKAAMDYAIALVLLMLSLPLMLAMAVVLRLRGAKRIIRGEQRVGLHGRQFRMFRFDVCLAEARPPGGPADPGTESARNRSAGFCRFLHRYSLSELPQLWNVLKGEMSIVGPRPETPERVRHYSEWHMRRLQVKPGITGLAQVRGLRASDSSDQKTRQDLEYVATFSPMLDLTLMVATPGALLLRPKEER